jgi:hypothetical protein
VDGPSGSICRCHALRLHATSAAALIPAVLQLRGQANPFIAAYEGSRSRRQAARTASLALGTLGGAATATRTSPFASADGLAGSGGSSASLPAAGPAAAPSRESSSAALEQELGSGGLGLLTAADSLPLPTPAQPAEVAVARVHYAPAARMLAIVLQDGRCVLCRTADAGVHPAEALQLFRWVYRPAGPAAPAAVAAALNPTAQLLAVGLSHGRIAIYTLQSLLAVRQPRRDSGSAAPGGGGGSGAPEPARLLSLSDWGFRSAVVGPAAQLRWSPDGQVLAAGYGGRGLAVWTPSGCRLMCTLRQAAATAPPAAAAADTHSLQASTPLPPPAGTAAAGTAAASTAAAGTAAGDSNGAEQLQRKSVEGGVGGLGWPLGGGGGPSQTTETGVLEVSLCFRQEPATRPVALPGTRSSPASGSAASQACSCQCGRSSPAKPASGPSPPPSPWLSSGFSLAASAPSLPSRLATPYLSRNAASPRLRCPPSLPSTHTHTLYLIHTHPPTHTHTHTHHPSHQPTHRALAPRSPGAPRDTSCWRLSRGGRACCTSWSLRATWRDPTACCRRRRRQAVARGRGPTRSTSCRCGGVPATAARNKLSAVSPPPLFPPPPNALGKTRNALTHSSTRRSTQTATVVPHARKLLASAPP